MTGLEAPTVSTRQHENKLLSGDRVVLTCVVTGKPQPNVYWTKGKRRIEPNQGTNLLIDHAAFDDAGEYICHAINPAGEDRTFVTLEIHTPPEIDKKSLSQTIIEGKVEFSINNRGLLTVLV